MDTISHKLAAHFGYNSQAGFSQLPNDAPPFLLDMQAYEHFKQVAVQRNMARYTELIQQERALYQKAQQLIHQPLNVFQPIPFRRSTGVLTTQCQWDWTDLRKITDRFTNWESFVADSRVDCSISLKYKPEMDDFIGQSHRGWFFILDHFSEHPLCLQDFVEAVFDMPSPDKLSKTLIQEKLFTSFKYLLYWGFIEQAQPTR